MIYLFSLRLRASYLFDKYPPITKIKFSYPFIE